LRGVGLAASVSLEERQVLPPLVQQRRVQLVAEPSYSSYRLSRCRHRARSAFVIKSLQRVALSAAHWDRRGSTDGDLAIMTLRTKIRSTMSSQLSAIRLVLG